MTQASESRRKWSRSVVRVFFLAGCALFAVVVIDHSLSLRLDRKAPEIFVTFGMLYFLFWSLSVPMTLLGKGYASSNLSIRRLSALLAVSVVLFVVERDYQTWALGQQISAVLNTGMPAEFGIPPTWDHTYTDGEESPMCGQRAGRELSWLNKWTGTIRTICVDVGADDAREVGVFYVHGRWMRLQQYLHWLTLLIVGNAGLKALWRPAHDASRSGKKASALKIEHAQQSDRADGTAAS